MSTLAAVVRSQLDVHLSETQAAARSLRSLSTEKKNEVLILAAQKLLEKEAQILTANQADLARLVSTVTDAFRDRLKLDRSRLEKMAESLRKVAALSDPVGEVVEQQALDNGLKVRRMRSPLGVIFMIYESRPNVAIEAFSLAFKAGNAIILRGGKESSQTTSVLYEILREALSLSGVMPEVLWGITTPDRAWTEYLLQQRSQIDVVVPRGGDSLIQYVVEHSKIPIIKNDRGMCHIYVHDDADLQMAERIVINSKTQRPGVCNAMETLLVHEKRAAEFLPSLYQSLEPFSVEWAACPRSLEILQGRARVSPVENESFDTEYLSLKMNVRIVASLDQAIEHIEEHGSRHSEAIITQSQSTARFFEGEVDAAVVYWNASTRFTDGFELGLGGELGISTQKLHVRGPVGLKELTSLRWVIEGTGQVRV